MLVNPMPRMICQAGKFGVLGAIDLNCGWYCTKALLEYWYEAIFRRVPTKLSLPKNKVCAFEPKDDFFHPAWIIEDWNPPTTAVDWETFITTNGPVIVNGKLGAADWGGARGYKAGVGHFILLVGADAAANTLSYKDPLQGNVLKTKDYDHTSKRLGDYVHYTNRDNALQIFNSPQVTIR